MVTSVVQRQIGIFAQKIRQVVKKEVSSRLEYLQRQ
jgi:hypothetical protein